MVVMLVKNPKIIDANRALDFGSGFYLTSDLKQAMKWAKVITERRGEGMAIVSIFEYDEDNDLNIKKFVKSDKEWLSFVSNHRKGNILKDNFDIVIGPVANDNTMPIINLYFYGYYNEEEAIKRLLTQKLKDQFVFKSEKALKYLHFLEGKYE